jgi:hypothetical protein
MKALADTLFDTEDEKKEFLKYTFAKDMKDYLTNLILNPV